MSASTIEIKEKIRLMLNLAENSAASEGEINNAMRFAAKLMATHHITQEEIDAYRGSGHEKAALYDRMASDVVYSQKMRLANWEIALVRFVEKFVGSVQHYLNNSLVDLKGDNNLIVFGEDGKPLQRRAFVFYGPSEDVELATDLYVELSFEIACMARMRFGGSVKGSGGDYASGFVAGLSERLRSQKALLASCSDSTALVVQSDKAIALKRETASQWLEKAKGIKLVGGAKRAAHKQFDAAAFGQGKADSEKWNQTQAKRQQRLN